MNTKINISLMFNLQALVGFFYCSGKVFYKHCNAVWDFRFKNTLNINVY